MPAISKKQRRLMAIAEHNPDAVYLKDRSVLQMKKVQLKEFAKTKEKGLPLKKAKKVKKFKK